MYRFLAFVLIFISFLYNESYCVQSKYFSGDSVQTPNIIFILVDDLGWSDIGFYGNKVHDTPHIDRLAKEGLSFTNAYAAAPICSPTRASILTGKSPASLHFEFVTKPDNSNPPAHKLLNQPQFPRDLPLEAITFAEVLNSVYQKGFFGKWHLTQENDRYLGWGDKMGPLQQGFDMGSEIRGSHPYGYSDDEVNTFGNYTFGQYPEDDLTNRVISFLRKNKDQPFLLYWSLYYVHTPVKTRSKWLYKKYQEKLGENNKKEIHYAAFMETMDHYVGLALDEIGKLGIKDNTVVIFTSDNGGHPSFTNNAPLNGNKWDLYEGGIRVPLIISWPEKIDKASVSDASVTSIDFFPTICKLTNSDCSSVGYEGKSLLPIITSQGNDFDNRSLYWHFPFYHPPNDYEGTTPSSAIRKGDYKMIYFYETERAELYNLEGDISEEHDLSDEIPQKTIQLKSQLFGYLKSVNARFPTAKIKSNSH